MSAAHDKYADWDAAYVLGALSPQDRHEFEGHLDGCAACRDLVAELASMPGLLAHVPAADVLASVAPTRDDEPPVPPSARPGASIADRRRRLGPLQAVAASVVLVLGGVGGYVTHDLLSPEPRRPVVASAPARVAFSAVIASPLTAVVDVVRTGSGTELRVECQYAAAGAAPSGGAVANYALYVIDRSGVSRLAKTWTANPDRVMQPVATSPLPIAELAAIEIREVDSGQTLARARL